MTTLTENDMKMIRMAVLVAAASAAASKAKEYARENPDKASQTIGKVESFLGAKAGPKYADKVGKGSEALRTSLGLPAGSAHGGTAATSSGPPGWGGAPASTAASPVDTSGSSSGQGAEGAPTDPPRGFDPSI